jgi:SAM-dependent MidA family methyltransferase
MRRVEHAGPAELSALLFQRIQAAIENNGGWLPFDRFMAMALYEPGLGYYSGGAPVLGASPADGSDFTTAPELSPLFGAAVARQVQQWLVAGAGDEIFEFGAGSGALAEQVLSALDASQAGLVRRYTIIELSGHLRARQQQRLARFGERVQWCEVWPNEINGMVLGNEVLDAMPVQLLHWDGTAWCERGVTCPAPGQLVWADRATALRPPLDGPALQAFAPGTVVEIHAQAEAFVRSLAERLQRGAALFIDYGFPQDEYYHPQRQGGTLVCHRHHRTELDAAAPLREPGCKDITAHVNFTGLALAAQDAGLEVAGYTTQARFLMNCGLLDLLHNESVDRPALQRARLLASTQKLLAEHEMGELFKAIAFTRGLGVVPLGFAAGDRTHTL